jgi:hypothetical protein
VTGTLAGQVPGRWGVQCEAYCMLILRFVTLLCVSLVCVACLDRIWVRPMMLQLLEDQDADKDSRLSLKEWTEGGGYR